MNNKRKANRKNDNKDNDRKSKDVKKYNNNLSASLNMFISFALQYLLVYLKAEEKFNEAKKLVQKEGRT